MYSVHGVCMRGKGINDSDTSVEEEDLIIPGGQNQKLHKR